jgi:hypothetical protein
MKEYQKIGRNQLSGRCNHLLGGNRFSILEDGRFAEAANDNRDIDA